MPIEHYKDDPNAIPHLISDDHGPLHIVVKIESQYVDEFGSSSNKLELYTSRLPKEDPKFLSMIKITWDQAFKLINKKSLC